ncbi:phosphorylase b kinase regulatory subunit alpha, liver isoform-like [Lytechinus pictus]|uniref:phosphorylase b kinase regulatory subunit alpha, liver isoform-like n=1 Tax=Lytechinus pictus TaxID=7653 RepID=UPI0030B9D28F
MRSRSNSGVRLDYYYRLVSETILAYQAVRCSCVESVPGCGAAWAVALWPAGGAAVPPAESFIFYTNPISGLLQATADQKHAWVRDNVYSIISVWGLALAYRKQADLDEDRAKAYELEQQVVKLMRGLLTSMMKQVEKVESFKLTQSPGDCLHAKYDSETGDTCVKDGEWGHLQIDATSLYLLLLSQMTVSGLQIVFTLDEVAFIQNLVFYIEDAYMIADYGVWERGDKTNHGQPELNSTSIGMAKGAMEAINDLDLFGARGGRKSVIHVHSDKIAQCQAILHSMLPRESSSKEIDAGLLSVIGYPAFAVDDESIINITRQQILDKLQGRYGCKRFLRDGHKTIKEDPNRLYYEPAELKIFENIECEWPLFWTYFVLDGIFRGCKEQVDEYSEALEELIQRNSHGTKVIPELFYVPADKVELEYKNPNSQDRLPGGKMPHLWGQSLYILGCLLREGFIAPGEIDPLNRRLSTEPKPDLVIQVVLLAEDEYIQEKLKEHGIQIKTVAEVAPIKIRPARAMCNITRLMGHNDKLGLSGNVKKEVGILSTSKLYSIHEKIIAFLPQFMDHHQFYLALDNDLLASICMNDMSYLRYNWRELGRPTMCIEVRHSMMEDDDIQRAILNIFHKFHSGYVNGVQVQMRNISDIINTSCIEKLSYLEGFSMSGSELAQFLEPSSYSSVPEPSLRGIKQLSTDSTTYHHHQHRNQLQHLHNLQQEQFQLSSDDEEGGIHLMTSTPVEMRRSPSGTMLEKGTGDHRRSSLNVHGIIQRTRSIYIEESSANPDTRPLMHLLNRKASISFNMPSIRHVESPMHIHIREQPVEQGDHHPHHHHHHHHHHHQATPPPHRKLTREGSLESYKTPYTPSLLHQDDTDSHDTVMEPSGKEIPLSSSPGKFHLRPDADGSFGSPMKRTPSWFEYKELEEIYKGQEAAQLVQQLQESDSLHEQADIVHYLYESKGLDWDTKINGKPGVTVKTLMEELYYKSAHHKTWSVVRHTAGILRKRVEHLSKSVTDLLVRQKQVSVGLPPEPREKIIYAPLPPEELETFIYGACGEDRSSAVLTQELLIYLSMFICTEPNLFTEMLRLRVGLIIQVMTSELARAMECEVNEAYEQLVTLSPFEIKDLLHHILSSREFMVNTTSHRSGTMERQLSIVSSRSIKFHGMSYLKGQISTSSSDKPFSTVSGDLMEEQLTERQGQWLRRRRLDGALNRAPPDFYFKVWKILEKCQGLRIVSHFLSQHLTREMTPHEFKFALRVEEVLNRIPEQEYRQLMVECLMVISLVVENEWIHNLGGVIATDRLVAEANELFLQDQVCLILSCSSY